MNPAVELNELMERIRHAANRENGSTRLARGEVTAASDLPTVPEALTLPPAPPIADTDADAVDRPEDLLDEAASMLLGGRKKERGFSQRGGAEDCCASFSAIRGDTIVSCWKRSSAWLN